MKYEDRINFSDKEPHYQVFCEGKLLFKRATVDSAADAVRDFLNTSNNLKKELTVGRYEPLNTVTGEISPKVVLKYKGIKRKGVV